MQPIAPVTTAELLAPVQRMRYKLEVYDWAHLRAAYAGGTLAGVLFRIVKLVKRPENNSVQITACVWGNSAT